MKRRQKRSEYNPIVSHVIQRTDSGGGEQNDRREPPRHSAVVKIQTLWLKTATHVYRQCVRVRPLSGHSMMPNRVKFSSYVHNTLRRALCKVSDGVVVQRYSTTTHTRRDVLKDQIEPNKQVQVPVPKCFSPPSYSPTDYIAIQNPSC